MKLLTILSAFREALPEPGPFWTDCLGCGCAGIAVEVRDARSFASYPLSDRRTLEEQCDWVRRLAEKKPPGAQLTLGPYDRASARALQDILRDELWFAPGPNQDFDMIRVAAHECKSLAIAINGLGPRAFAALLQTCEEVRPTLWYVAGENEQIQAITQLAWLRAQGHASGLVSSEATVIFSAAALGAEAVMVPWLDVQNRLSNEQDVARLRQIVNATKGNGYRPIALSEVERMADTEVCLVAARRINSGHVMTEADVTVRAVRHRGLAPYLVPQVLHRVARYPIEEGQPVRFALLWEKGRRG